MQVVFRVWGKVPRQPIVPVPTSRSHQMYPVDPRHGSACADLHPTERRKGKERERERESGGSPLHPSPGERNERETNIPALPSDLKEWMTRVRCAKGGDGFGVGSTHRRGEHSPPSPYRGRTKRQMPAVRGRPSGQGSPRAVIRPLASKQARERERESPGTVRRPHARERERERERAP